MKIKFSFLLILISTLSFSQDKKTIKNFVESFVEYKMQKKTFNKIDEQVLLVGMLNSDDCLKCKSLQIQMDVTNMLIDFPYKNVFDVRSFKTIVYENEYSKNFDGIFKKLPFENLNLGDPQIIKNMMTNNERWSFVFNNKNEIEWISGFQGDSVFLDFLKNKNFNFSKDFDKNMSLD